MRLRASEVKDINNLTSFSLHFKNVYLVVELKTGFKKITVSYRHVRVCVCVCVCVSVM